MTRPGTIALVSPRYPPAIGGVERQVEMLARGLVADGIDVEVITTDPTGRLPPLERRDGVLVRRFRTLRGDAVYFVAPQLWAWLFRHTGHYALVHAHSYHTPLALAAAVAARRHRVPLVVSPVYHGTGHSLVRRWLHTPYRPLGSWLLHQARTVVCVSEAERALLQRHFRPTLPTVVIPCGVATETCPPPLAPEGKVGSVRAQTDSPATVVILAVGRLERYKQTERLVDAMPWLPHQYELAVVGDGPRRNAIQNRATELRVQARVRTLGHLPQPNLVRWYRAADVFATLSRRESFGLTVLEAAVAGCAVVLSDIPAHRELARYVPAGRLVFVPVDASSAELASALQQAASLKRAVGVEQWRLPTWPAMVDHTLACYQAVLAVDRCPRQEVVA